MTIHHPTLKDGRWHELSLSEQMANVGSEVERAISWRAKGNAVLSDKALERAMELLRFTIDDPRHRKRLKELTRLREVLTDYFRCENEYGSSDALWRGYFRFFTLRARGEVLSGRTASSLPALPGAGKNHEPSCS